MNSATIVLSSILTIAWISNLKYDFIPKLSKWTNYIVIPLYINLFILSDSTLKYRLWSVQYYNLIVTLVIAIYSIRIILLETPGMYQKLARIQYKYLYIIVPSWYIIVINHVYNSLPNIVYPMLALPLALMTLPTFAKIAKTFVILIYIAIRDTITMILDNKKKIQLEITYIEPKISAQYPRSLRSTLILTPALAQQMPQLKKTWRRKRRLADRGIITEPQLSDTIAKDIRKLYELAPDDTTLKKNAAEIRHVFDFGDDIKIVRIT